MRNGSRNIAKTAGIVGLVVLPSAGLTPQAAADEVFDWNITGFEASVAGGQNPIHISRTMAIMHLAV